MDIHFSLTLFCPQKQIKYFNRENKVCTSLGAVLGKDGNYYFRREEDLIKMNEYFPHQNLLGAVAPYRQYADYTGDSFQKNIKNHNIRTVEELKKTLKDVEIHSGLKNKGFSVDEL